MFCPGFCRHRLCEVRLRGHWLYTGNVMSSYVRLG